MFIRTHARVYRNPADDNGSDTGGSVDRGDVVIDQKIEQAQTEDASDKSAEQKTDVTDTDAGADKGSDKGSDKGDDKSDDKDGDQARDDKGRFKPKTIPLDRHEGVLNRERIARQAAEARIAELESQLKQQDTTDTVKALEAEIETMEGQLEAARLDGNKDEAVRLAREIRLKEREVVKAETARNSGANTDQMREEMRMDTVIEKMELQYPALNEKSDLYDQDLVDLVLAAQQDLIRRERLAPSVALEAAAVKVMSKIQTTKIDADDKGDTGLKNAKGALEDRKQAQLDKNIDTQNKQPPSTKEVGQDSDKLGQTKEDADVTQMTYEDFAALPEATKKRMRGDAV